MKRKTIRKRLKKIMTVCMLGASAVAVLLARLCYDLARCHNASFGHFAAACIAAAFLYGFGWAGMTLYDWLYVREQRERTKNDEQKDGYHG